MKYKITTPKINVTIRTNVLKTIFDECDRYDNSETGGRILGTFERNDAGTLQVKVSGVIDAGPNSRRSSSSFFNDGDYQAKLFRRIEHSYPDIEHLGNWHTHHVNGYPTLSNGDISTYRRIVNHPKHNLEFFYALLVVQRNQGSSSLDRYRVRHYILFRGDDGVYEINSKKVSLSTEEAIWPIQEENESDDPQNEFTIRASDKKIIDRLYPSIHPYQSAQTKNFFWRGSIQLIDDTVVQLTTLELTKDNSNSTPQYVAIVKGAPIACSKISNQIDTQFSSAAEAIYSVEKKMNQLLYQAICEVEM